MSNKITYETQPLPEQSQAEPVNTTSLIEDAQRIEGAGPPKKINLNELPRPLRIFGYFILGVISGIGIIMLLIISGIIG